MEGGGAGGAGGAGRAGGSEPAEVRQEGVCIPALCPGLGLALTTRHAAVLQGHHLQVQMQLKVQMKMKVQAQVQQSYKKCLFVPRQKLSLGC